MANVFGSVADNISFTEVITTGLISQLSLPVSIVAPQVPLATTTYTNGTGSLQVDTIYGKQLSLAATTTTLDLTSLTDLNGASITFARVRFFFVLTLTVTTGFDVKVYQGASNPWAPLPASGNPGWARYNGGSYRLHDPFSTGSGNGNVVTSTSKTVVLDPGANTVSVYVLAVGGSVA